MSEESATPARTPTCPFCGGAGRQAFDATDRNRGISQERFAYARCEACATVFVVAAPRDLGRYYAGDYYQFDRDGEPSWRREQPLIESASYRVGLIGRYVARGHVIEIGAGTGAFASAAQQAGFDVTAIEMDERCCDYLNGRGIRAICSDDPLAVLDSLPPARAVAMWHVLEHLSNPAEVIERVVDKLEPGGVLAIGVPNPRSLQFRLLKARWAHLDAPRHLCLVPPDALARKAEDLGMRCMEMTTNDPDGLASNRFGWLKSLERRPARRITKWLTGHAGFTAHRLMGPLERTGNRGSAVTLLMRRESAGREAH
jgi:SAM-dependent methyltransferase